MRRISLVIGMNLVRFAAWSIHFLNVVNISGHQRITEDEENCVRRKLEGGEMGLRVSGNF